VARTNEEAERQAAGEDVIASAADEDRALAEAQAAVLFEAGAEREEEDAALAASGDEAETEETES
jgi:large subunit ribosomal protein L9